MCRRFNSLLPDYQLAHLPRQIKFSPRITDLFFSRLFRLSSRPSSPHSDHKFLTTSNRNNNKKQTTSFDLPKIDLCCDLLSNALSGLIEVGPSYKHPGERISNGHPAHNSTANWHEPDYCVSLKCVYIWLRVWGVRWGWWTCVECFMYTVVICSTDALSLSPFVVLERRKTAVRLAVFPSAALSLLPTIPLRQPPLELT